MPVTSKKTGKKQWVNQPASKVRPSVSKNGVHNTNSYQEGMMVQDITSLNKPDKEDESKLSENCNPEPSSLFEFITYYFQGKSFKELGKKLTHFLANEQLADDQITEITNFVKENDLDLNKTRALSELMLKGSCYNKDNYQSMFDLLECVINFHLNTGIAETNKLSRLIEENNGKKIVDIFVEKIETTIKHQQKSDKDSNQSTNSESKKKISYPVLKTNLILIGCSWLYHFEHVDENIIINCLSASVFRLKEGTPEKSISIHALALISSMHGGKNKNEFAYLLSFFTKNNAQNQNKSLKLNDQVLRLENENSKLSIEIEDYKKEIETLSYNLNSSECEVARLKSQVIENIEYARHQEIHLKDINNKSQSIFLRFLEDDIFNMLLDVQKGLQRSPPKIETAESYLEVVIEKIQEKMKCLK